MLHLDTTMPQTKKTKAPYDYLMQQEKGSESDLHEGAVEHGRQAAHYLIREQVHPALMELAAETIARMAKVLIDEQALNKDKNAKPIKVFSKAVLEAINYIGLPQPALSLVRLASARGLTPVRLAALGFHVLDIAEAMAQLVYVPELPALNAKSDRSADAARHVGAARHLRG